MNSTFEKMSSMTDVGLPRQAKRSSKKATEERIFTKTLIASATAAAFAGLMGVSGAAMAATEIKDGDSITATDTTGLNESDATAAVGITIDSNSAGITLGVDGTKALDVTSDNAAADVTITVTTSGTANGVTFADDITTTNADSIVTINATNDDVTFQGNIDMAGTSPADINLGSSSADPTVTMTVDTAVDGESITIEATIDAVDSGDTANLTIVDSNTTVATETVTFKNDIGSSVALDTITIGDATTVSNVTFEGSVSAGSIAFSGGTTDDVVTIGGDSAQTITGPITAGATGYGSIIVSNTKGTVTFASALGTNGGALLNALTLNTDSTTVFSDTVDVTTLTMQDDSTATFNEEVNTGTLVLGTAAASSGPVNIKIGSGFEESDKVITVSTTLTENVTADGGVVFEMSSQNLADDESFTVIAGPTSPTSSYYKVVDTALFDYTLSVNTNDIVVTAEANDVGEVASALGIESQEASALMNAYQSLDTDNATDATLLATLDSALNTAGSGGNNAQAKKIAQQVGVQADTLGATSSAAVETSHEVVGVAAIRLASLRTGSQYAGGQSGLASGDSAAPSAFWIRPFGTWTDQDKRGGVEGYDADTYGIAGGIDTQVSPNSRLGASIAYADTDVDGDGVGNSQADIDSYHFTVYGDYTTDAYYLQGMFSYANGDNDISEQVSGLTRKGSYDSDQYTFSIGGGKPIALQGDAYITPMADFTWTHVSYDSYTTSGASGYNVKVNPDDVDSAVLSLGAQYHTIIPQGKGSLIPSVYGGITYDFADERAQSTSSFVNGGSSFTTRGVDPEDFGGELGLGLTYDDGMFSVGANYGFEFKSDYTSHAAMVQARWKF